jgi:calcineurin-like phosphoesterase family protein
MVAWFTSDHHLRHKFVAGLRWKEFFGSNKPSSEQALLDWHDTMLAERWDQNVKKDDIVYVLGDCTIGDKDVPCALEWFNERPGRKRLVPGNHDPCHPMHTESSKWQKRFMLSAFESVELHTSLKFVVNPEEKKRSVLLSHMPYNGDHTEEDRFEQWRLPNEGKILLHGHTHSAQKVTLATVGIVALQIHVGLDAWDFSPVSLENIVKIIKEETS